MFIYSFNSALHCSKPGIPHTHNNHEFFFCIDGNCWQQAGETVFPIGPSGLCLLPQGVPHCAYKQSDTAASTNIVVNVDEEYLSSRQDGDREAREIFGIFCRRAYAGKYVLELGRASRKTVCSLLPQMTEETRQHRPGWQTAVKAAFISLLVAIYRGWPPTAPLDETLPAGNKQERMRSVFAYIDNNYMKPLMVEDILPLAHLSRSRFHAVFAAEAGCPFKVYLNRLRIAQAERALKESSLPVTQIALGCGFNSLSQFYAVFKELKGTPPRSLRR